MTLEKIIEQFIPNKFEVKKEGNLVLFSVSEFELPEICVQFYQDHGFQLKTIAATDERKEGVGFRIFYVFGVPNENVFIAPYLTLQNKTDFTSITKKIHEASGYERKIKSFFGLEPVNHPNPRGMLLHENWPGDLLPLRKDFNWQERPPMASGSYEFSKVKGEGVYEIPVGPVHAGIIEPGHFRFSVAGEEIVLLEPKLGYKHKGTEKLFEILPMGDKVKLAERVSGDTSFTHSLAFCQAAENLADIEAPERAKYLRVIYSEMERLANHFNDIGFIMLDTGYSFGGSNGARLREMIMQWNEKLTGSRFLRGVNAIGGVDKDISASDAAKLARDLRKIQKDFNEVIEISEDSSTLLNRLLGTGKLNYKIAVDHGVIGIVARAMGIPHDARIEYPYGAYNKLKFDMAMEKDGDVRSRLYIRIKEVASSIAIIEQAIKLMPDGKIKSDKQFNLRPNSFGIGLTEGWRGDILYFVKTDALGKIDRVEVRDPSFVNWSVLSHAGLGNVVPDFPLINKSFNLSYSGNDL